MPLPQARMHRFLRKGAAEFPEFAEEQLQVAYLLVEFDGALPLEVRRVCFECYRVTKEGALVAEDAEAFKRLALSALPQRHGRQDAVVDARDRFERKRDLRTLRWEPSHELKEQMRLAVLGR